MPKQLKKKFQITPKCEKNTKSQNGKMSDQKKKDGIPHPLKQEQTRNAKTSEKKNLNIPQKGRNTFNIPTNMKKY